MPEAVDPRRVVVFGATGGTGRAACRALLDSGHAVTAFARDPARLEDLAIEARTVVGDALIEADVHAAIEGHDAVIDTLGNSQNPFALLLPGVKRTTAGDICETGTRHIVSGMARHGLRRLVVVSAFGVGDTRRHASAMVRLYLRLLLKEHMADKERMETLVKASTLDWTLVHPPALVDAPVGGRWHASGAGELGRPAIARADLAGYLVEALKDRSTFGRTVTVSGARD